MTSALLGRRLGRAVRAGLLGLMCLLSGVFALACGASSVSHRASGTPVGSATASAGGAARATGTGTGRGPATGTPRATSTGLAHATSTAAPAGPMLDIVPLSLQVSPPAGDSRTVTYTLALQNNQEKFLTPSFRQAGKSNVNDGTKSYPAKISFDKPQPCSHPGVPCNQKSVADVTKVTMVPLPPGGTMCGIEDKSNGLLVLRISVTVPQQATSLTLTVPGFRPARLVTNPAPVNCAASPNVLPGLPQNLAVAPKDGPKSALVTIRGLDCSADPCYLSWQITSQESLQSTALNISLAAVDDKGIVRPPDSYLSDHCGGGPPAKITVDSHNPCQMFALFKADPDPAYAFDPMEYLILWSGTDSTQTAIRLK